MSDLRAAAEQALDTLEHVQAHIGRYDPPVVTTIARAMQPTIDALRSALAAEQPQPEAQPVAWREHVEQRIRSWRQRTMNRYGDRLAIDDYMSADAIDDLVDYVCDEYAAPPPSAPCPHIRSSGTGEWATNWCALNGPPAAPEPSEAEVEAGIAAMDDVYSHPAQQRAAITEQDREAMRAALRAAAAARGR